MKKEEKEQFEQLQERCQRWRAKAEKYNRQRQALAKEKRDLIKAIKELEKKYE